MTTDEIIGIFTPNIVNNVLVSYSYLPSNDFVGNLEVKYVVSDNKGPGIAGSSTLVVNAVNDAPTATFTIDQVASEGGDSIVGQLTATDTEVITGEVLESSLVYGLVGDPVSGFTLQANGSFTFDPTDDAYQYLAAGESTTLTINYSVTDASGSVANNSFEILVTGTNTDPKVALDQVHSFVNATEDIEYLITTAELLQGYSDLDASDQLSVESLAVYKADNAGLATTEAAGALNPVIENGVVTGYRFTPLDDYFGNAVFTYIVSDGNGPGTNSTFTIAVNPVQDAPRPGNLGPDGLNLGSTLEDTQFTFTEADLLSGYTDPDGTPLIVKPGSISTKFGVVTLDGTTYTYTPNANFNGPTSIDYTIVDSAGAEVDTSKLRSFLSMIFQLFNYKILQLKRTLSPRVI